MKKTLLFLILLITIQLNAQTVNLSNGLICAFPFNPEGATVSLADTTGNTSDLHYIYWLDHIPVEDRYGNANSAVEFETHELKDRIFRHQPSPLFYPYEGAERSFSMWVKKPQAVDYNYEAGIQFLFFYGQIVQSKGCGLAINFFNDVLIFAGYEDDLEVIYDFPIDSWVHLCAVYANDTAKLYINGELSGEAYKPDWNTVNTTTINYGFLNYSIPQGGSQKHYHNKFFGYVDDIHIYNRALNTNEIKTLADVPINENPSSVYTIENATALQLYPNPTNGLITIQHRDLAQAQLEIINLHGKTIYNNQGVNSVDLSSFSPGTYVLKLSTPTETLFKPFVKY